LGTADPGKRRSLKTWDEYMALAKRIVGRFHDKFELNHFTYMHPERLQRRTRCASASLTR
jgi:hypothetical protein